MSPLELAKQALPLPQLMERLGLGDLVKKSARCPFHDDSSNSFSVFQSPDGQFRWNCFAGCTPEGKPGDGPDLIAKLENLSSSDACKRYIELAGVSANGSGYQSRAVTPTRRRATTTKQPQRVPDMPLSAADAWQEGLEYLQERPPVAARLASQRGWPIDFAQDLILHGGMAMVTHEGQRGIAFQVVAPQGERGAMTTYAVGYHVRVKEQEKYSWRYRPTGTPGLPYILGDFDTASLLVITEGQWDALTFAFAAGWLGEGCVWPKGVGLIGIRGTSGHSAFLAHYRRYWPESADCLLLPDNDEPGKKWHTGDDCFAVQLSRLCRRVAVVNCAPHKDFNDLFRAERPAPNDVLDILAAHEMAIAAQPLCGTESEVGA